MKSMVNEETRMSRECRIFYHYHTKPSDCFKALTCWIKFHVFNNPHLMNPRHFTRYFISFQVYTIKRDTASSNHVDIQRESPTFEPPTMQPPTVRNVILRNQKNLN